MAPSVHQRLVPSLYGERAGPQVGGRQAATPGPGQAVAMVSGAGQRTMHSAWNWLPGLRPNDWEAVSGTGAALGQ